MYQKIITVVLMVISLTACGISAKVDTKATSIANEAVNVNAETKEHINTIASSADAENVTDTNPSEAESDVAETEKIYVEDLHYSTNDFDEATISYVKENMATLRSIYINVANVPEHLIIPTEIIKLLNDNSAYLAVYYGATTDGGIFSYKGGIAMSGMNGPTLPEEDIDKQTELSQRAHTTSIVFGLGRG